MPGLLRHLEDIQKLPSGGYRIPEGVEAVLTRYLRAYGFELSWMNTYRELLVALRFCNAQDFARAVDQPAPMPELRFLWRRLRRHAQER